MAPVVPPKLGSRSLNKNPVCDAQKGVLEASLTHLGYGLVDYRLIPFALITVATPTQAIDPFFDQDVRPATLRAIRHRRTGKVHTCSSLSEPSFRRVLVLFAVFEISVVGRIYTVMYKFCQE